MAPRLDPIPKHPTPPVSRRITPTEWLVIVLCGVWLLGASYLFFGRHVGQNEFPQENDLSFFTLLAVIFVPMAVVAVITSVARTIRLLREECQYLRRSIQYLRNAPLEHPLPDDHPADTDATATFSSVRNRPEINPQADLALGLAPAPEHTTVPNDILIRALHFPFDADDQAGFDALRFAMGDRTYQRLINAAEDILTLLSKDAVYMEDLHPDRSQPDVWRRFALGARGGQISGLGGIRDKNTLGLVAGRLRQDQGFREAAHNFLVQYDSMFQDFVEDATDREIAAMTDTRSARAFMLLGRVIGIFD